MAAALSIGLLAVPQGALAADPSPVAADPSPVAAGPSPVTLGLATPFAVLAGGPAITSTGPTFVTGDVGIDPYPTVAGLSSGDVVGMIHRADRIAAAAKHDLEVAYQDAARRPSGATTGTLGGLTLTSGVYAAGDATLDLTGTLTLDGAGDPRAVWIFQSAADLTTAARSAVRLVNGAEACNVFWQVTGSATLGAGSMIVGTILAETSIALESGATLAGRALALNGAVTMIGAAVTGPGCAAPILGTPAYAAGPAESPMPRPGAVSVSYRASNLAPPAARTGGIPLVVPAAIVLSILLAIGLGEAPKPRRRVHGGPRWHDASGYR